MCADVSQEIECNIPGVLERQRQQNYHLPLSVSSASADDDSIFLIILGQLGISILIFSFDFFYIEAVTCYILSDITESKVMVNSKSEMILLPVFLFGCFCHVSFILYICLSFN